MRNGNSHLTDLLEQHAMLRPDNTAVISKARETSYGDLVRHVNSLSAWLADRGITRETPVAVCADRSLAWIVSVLAILRVGGVYIPLDPLAPLQQKKRMLEDAGVRMLLIEPHVPAVFLDSIEQVKLHLDRPDGNPTNRKAEIIPGQAAYGIYTSGSTGLPKNVIVSYASLGNYVEALCRELKLTTSDRYLHTASVAFSASIRQIAAPLAAGATVVLAARDEIQDPESLISRMLQSGVTVLDTVPSYLARWLGAVQESPRDWKETLATSLRLVLTTGEPLSASIVRFVRNQFPGIPILNLYGQTETTGTVALHEIEADRSDPIPIGQALFPCDFYVLNEQFEPTDEGELWISGPCLARCYQGQPDLTATRFCPDPFGTVAGGRMYRTGDRVRRFDHGLFQFKGREDDQVKIHGIRVGLGQIDTILSTHPNVREVATVLRPLQAGAPAEDWQLVAFVVPRSEQMSLDAENVRTFLAATFTDAMIPTAVIFVRELPRTASGKIDRPALVEQEIGQTMLRSSSAAPSTELERLVAECWEEVLGVRGIGIDDDFFALGGDSLQAIDMILRLHKLIPHLPLSALFFEDPSLRAFVNKIEIESVDEAALFSGPLDGPASG